MDKDKIVIVGCGAIGDVFYFPQFAKDPTLKNKLCLVDKDAARVSELKESWGFSHGSTNLEDFFEESKVGIIATPPASHFPLAEQMLEAGLDVVIEKPLTNTHEEGQRLCALAERKGRKITVNNTRRFYPQSQEIKRIIDSQVYGKVLSIDYLEGGEFAWPSVSGFYFQKGARGALSDRGAHVLDLLCWWLGDDGKLQEAFSNSRGGVEALAECKLKFGEATCRVKISWHNKLANKITIVMEKATIVADLYELNKITLQTNGGSQSVVCPGTVKSYMDCATAFHREITKMWGGDYNLHVEGRHVLASLRLIDEYYDQAKQFEETWFAGL